jgi:hypothetical protein
MPTLRRLPPAGRVAMLFCAAFLISCEPREEPADTALNTMVQERSPLPVAEPPLDRERLLLAAARTASAFAAGADDSAAQRELNGKRFEIRFRIGCDNGGARDEMRGWRFDEKTRTLRIRVEPDLSSDDPVLVGISGGRFESVEGLWVNRPWMLTAACPKVSPPAPPVADVSEKTGREPGAQSQEPQGPEPQTSLVGRRVGIAQFFTTADSRTSRRKQRPYETTKVLDEGQGPSRQGYDFVMAGRLRALPGRRVIVCASDSAEAPPACVISVHVDRAWLERPDNRELVAEWTGG